MVSHLPSSMKKPSFTLKNLLHPRASPPLLLGPSIFQDLNTVNFVLGFFLKTAEIHQAISRLRYWHKKLSKDKVYSINKHPGFLRMKGHLRRAHQLHNGLAGQQVL